MMALPKLETPTYRMKIPSTGKTISYRPFLVKEEKLLLMVRESKMTEERVNLIKNLISSCIVDEIDIKSLTVYDIEYIFLNLRSKSVGEEIDLMMECDSCNKKTPCVLNLETDVKIKKPSKAAGLKIPLTSTVGLMMRHPGIDSMLYENPTPMQVVISCLESIYDDKTVHRAEDYTTEDLEEFLGSLSVKQIEKVKDFFEEMPKVEANISFKCPSCEKDNNVCVQGLASFF